MLLVEGYVPPTISCHVLFVFFFLSQRDGNFISNEPVAPNTRTSCHRRYFSPYALLLLIIVLAHHLTCFCFVLFRVANQQRKAM